MKERRVRKKPRRQLRGVVGAGILTLILGQKNAERALNVNGANRRKAKGRRQPYQ